MYVQVEKAWPDAAINSKSEARVPGKQYIWFHSCKPVSLSEDFASENGLPMADTSLVDDFFMVLNARISQSRKDILAFKEIQSANPGAMIRGNGAMPAVPVGNVIAQLEAATRALEKIKMSLSILCLFFIKKCVFTDEPQCRQYFSLNSGNIFLYTHPFQKGGSSKCSQENLWIEDKYVVVPKAFPSIFQWQEVCLSRSVEKSPFTRAIEDVHERARKLREFYGLRHSVVLCVSRCAANRPRQGEQRCSIPHDAGASFAHLWCCEPDCRRGPSCVRREPSFREEHPEERERL